MQQYFQKLSGSAIKAARQGIQIITAAAEAALTPINSQKRPQDEFLSNFRSACNIIDELANRPDADTPDADNLLFESRIKYHLKTMLILLQEESDTWFHEINDPNCGDLSEMPCFDQFLQYHVTHELCKRAIRDTPRGTLPLILGTLASWIRGVKHPLLPHQSVHKHVARLISVAARYEALHYSAAGALTDSGKLDLINYKKRVGEGSFYFICVVIYID